MKNPIFSANPSLDCYFETADESCFYLENAAQAHADTLTNREVKMVCNTDSSESVESETNSNLNKK